MTLAQHLALWADKLRDVSARGLMFSRTVYDQENYETVQDIAMRLLAVATDDDLESLEPLRAPIFSRPSPLATGDAAIFDEGGRLLLVQRADNEQWALPGGAMDVGETPAEGVVREALEETGIRCVPHLLIGVYDSRLRGTVSRHHLYQFLFLCSPLPTKEDQLPPSHAHEVLTMGWFSEDALPHPIDPGHVRPIRDAFAAWNGRHSAYFDRFGES